MIQNEIFGPVITVQSFDDEDQAVEWANGVPYRLAFGCVWINGHIAVVAETLAGGYKKPGYGKDLWMYGLEDYTRIKHAMSYIERGDG